jgi:paraquat-inducible protein B
MVYVEEVSTQVITPLETLQTKIETDLKTIHNSVQEQLTDLENCKKLVINKKNGMDSQLSLEDLENALEQLEDLHSKPMESAMSKLESLELYRIETAREIMLYAVMAEKNLYDDITKAVEVMQSTLKNIDVNRDVKELTVLFGHDLARNEMF